MQHNLTSKQVNVIKLTHDQNEVEYNLHTKYMISKINWHCLSCMCRSAWCIILCVKPVSVGAETFSCFAIILAFQVFYSSRYLLCARVCNYVKFGLSREYSC